MNYGWLFIDKRVSMTVGQLPSFDAGPMSGHFTESAGPLICKSSGRFLVEYVAYICLLKQTFSRSI